MAIKTGEQLKSQFSSGKLPKNSDYEDLIDSCLGGGDTGPVIVNAFIEDYPDDELEYHYSVDYKKNEDEEIIYDDEGNPIILKVHESFSNLLTQAQTATLKDADPGAMVIFTNKNKRRFYIDNVPIDGGPSSTIQYEQEGYREAKTVTYVLAEHGSLMFIKVGEHVESASQSGYITNPVYSVVALAIQGGGQD